MRSSPSTTAGVLPPNLRFASTSARKTEPCVRYMSNGTISSPEAAARLATLILPPQGPRSAGHDGRAVFLARILPRFGLGDQRTAAGNRPDGVPYRDDFQASSLYLLA